MERNERKLQKRNLKRKLLEVLRNFIKNTNTLVYVQFKNLQKLRPSMSKVHHIKCKPWLYHHDSKEGVTKDFLWISVWPGGVCFCRRAGGALCPAKHLSFCLCSSPPFTPLSQMAKTFIYFFQNVQDYLSTLIPMYANHGNLLASF